jgi:hypothetical protein
LEQYGLQLLVQLIVIVEDCLLQVFHLALLLGQQFVEFLKKLLLLVVQKCY